MLGSFVLLAKLRRFDNDGFDMLVWIVVARQELTQLLWRKRIWKVAVGDGDLVEPQRKYLLVSILGRFKTDELVASSPFFAQLG